MTVHRPRKSDEHPYSRSILDSELRAHQNAVAMVTKLDRLVADWNAGEITLHQYLWAVNAVARLAGEVLIAGSGWMSWLDTTSARTLGTPR